MQKEIEIEPCSLVVFAIYLWCLVFHCCFLPFIFLSFAMQCGLQTKWDDLVFYWMRVGLLVVVVVVTVTVTLVLGRLHGVEWAIIFSHRLESRIGQVRIFSKQFKSFMSLLQMMFVCLLVSVVVVALAFVGCFIAQILCHKFSHTNCSAARTFYDAQSGNVLT